MATAIFYIQPLEEEPHLDFTALKEGVYKEVDPSSAEGAIIYLTEVGKAVWALTRSISEDATLDLVETVATEDNKAWEILIGTPELNISLRAVRYIPETEHPEGFYVSLEFDAAEELIIDFIGKEAGFC